MHTTPKTSHPEAPSRQVGLRRSSACALAATLILGGSIVPQNALAHPAPEGAPAASADISTVKQAHLTWGFMPNIREYASHPRTSTLRLVDMNRDENGIFSWHSGTGSYSNGQGSVMFPGMLSLRGNRSQLNVQFSNVHLNFSEGGTRGVLTLDAAVDTLDGQHHTYRNIQFAIIDTSSLRVADGTLSLNNAALTMTNSGKAVFDGTGIISDSPQLDPITLSAPLGPATFSDVPAGSFLHPEIEWIASRGITHGYNDGTFRPTQNIERGAVAAYFYRLAGSPTVILPEHSPFSDVPEDHPFYKEIVWLHRMGITRGYEDGTFRPGDPVNRDAVAAFIYRAEQQPQFDAPEQSPFTDVAPGDQFYREITWMQSKGMTTGWPDSTFRPDQPVNRDAMAAFAYRIGHC